MRSKEAEEHFDRGIHFFRGGFYPAALQEFRRVQQITPGYPNIDYILEATQKKTHEVAGQMVAFIEESFDEETRELSKQLIIEGSSTLAVEVERLLRDDRPQEALHRLEQAHAIIPESLPLLLLKASIQRRLGKLNEAEQTLLRAKALFPEHPGILNNLGNLYLARNLFLEAGLQFEEARSLAPNDVRILNNLGALKMQTYRLDDAQDLFTEVLRKHPRWSVAQRNLQNVTARINELEGEITRLRDEYSAHPSYLDIGLALGKCLLFRGFSHEAESLLSGLIRRNPNLVAAYFFLGTIHEMVGETEKAIKAYREMVIRKKKSEAAEFQTFESLYKEGYLEEALYELKKLAVLDLDLAASRIKIGIRYFEETLWEEALRHFKEAAAINTSYPDAYYWTALSRIQMGKRAAAERDLRQALELNARYADAHYQLGILLQKKAPRKAREHLRNAMELGLRTSFAAVARRILQGAKNA